MTARAYKGRDAAMDRMRADYRVEHDLVDAAPHPETEPTHFTRSRGG